MAAAKKLLVMVTAMFISSALMAETQPQPADLLTKGQPSRNVLTDVVNLLGANLGMGWLRSREGGSINIKP